MCGGKFGWWRVCAVCVRTGEKEREHNEFITKKNSAFILLLKFTPIIKESEKKRKPNFMVINLSAQEQKLYSKRNHRMVCWQ